MITYMILKLDSEKASDWEIMNKLTYSPETVVAKSEFKDEDELEELEEIGEPFLYWG